ncbi:MAG TPA: hypothetical protein VLV49_16020 [Terriglobales bacterium]|nr:hypothetical protein [Terriglobales bacterium]
MKFFLRVLPVVWLLCVLISIISCGGGASAGSNDGGGTVPPPGPSSTPAHIYGNGMQSFSGGLENLRFELDETKMDIRWRAEQSSNIQSVVLFMKTGNGYSGGTGGLVNISLQSDDGSASHFPSGTELDSSQAAPGNPASPTFREFVFTTHAALTSGTLYHFVLTDPDPAPSSNYVSLNNMGNNGGTRQPYYSLTDWTLNVQRSSGWQAKADSCPIASIKWTNGTTQGMGYVDAPAHSQLFTIQGSNEAGETFTVSGGDKVVTAVSFHVQKTGSPGPLTVTLNSGSSTVANGTIAASAVSSSIGWATFTFSSPITLSNGTSYHLFLTSAADSNNYYQTWPMMKGFTSGLDTPSEFHDGNYETNGIGDSDLDMQFYFALQ